LTRLSQVGGHDKLGVQVIRLKQLNPDIQQTFTLNLLKNYDQSDPANKKNRGQIALELEYKPFDGNEEGDAGTDLDQIEGDIGKTLSIPRVTFDPSPATITPSGGGFTTAGGGLLLVTIHAAEDVEGKSHTNPYARIIFRGEKRRTKVSKSLRRLHFRIFLESSREAARII
jgi:hypothetical protein